jgi:hypothetical protein
MPKTYTIRTFAVVFALLVVLATTNRILGQEPETKPPNSPTPLTAEQISVYRAVFVGWFENEQTSLNLAEQTVLPSSLNLSASQKSCMKGIRFEAGPRETHNIRPEDLMQLDLNNIRLVDPDAHTREVREHDPGNGIRSGKSVDEAVSDGFAHGLFTFSEIRFDKSHHYAVVSFSFRCGALCGHGSTMLLKKTDGKWSPKKQCSGWVS